LISSNNSSFDATRTAASASKSEEWLRTKRESWWKRRPLADCVCVCVCVCEEGGGDSPEMFELCSCTWKRSGREEWEDGGAMGYSKHWYLYITLKGSSRSSGTGRGIYSGGLRYSVGL